MDAKVINLGIVRFGGRVHVGRAEARALMNWYKDIRMVDLPLLAEQRGGRYVVIQGGAS